MVYIQFRGEYVCVLFLCLIWDHVPTSLMYFVKRPGELFSATSASLSARYELQRLYSEANRIEAMY